MTSSDNKNQKGFYLFLFLKSQRQSALAVKYYLLPNGNVPWLVFLRWQDVHQEGEIHRLVRAERDTWRKKQNLNF